MKSRASVRQSAGAYGAANTAVNSVAPAITGLTTTGAVLTCSTGTWSLTPTFTFQWHRGSSPIPGETAATHTIVVADRSTSLTCTVVATNRGVPAVKVTAPFAIPA